ncbi:transposase [Paenibacillus terrae]|uniref:transposase n=1 Tax=Paenibacillus terrae TaxID=159743 RepID=UPI003B8A6B74
MHNYDEYYDQYICPNDESLLPSRVTREGYRMYSSNKVKCTSCSLLEKCTQSVQHKKVILRHLWHIRF